MALKYNKKNRAIVSGIMVGLASIYAVASYFNVEWAELNGFMLSTLLFFVTIVLLAVAAILVIKGLGRLVRMVREKSQDDSSKHE
jgi:hypothetical protein